MILFGKKYHTFSGKVSYFFKKVSYFWLNAWGGSFEGVLLGRKVPREGGGEKK